MELSKGGGFQKKYYTGFTTGKVVAINPTKEEYEELHKYKLNNPPVYEGKTAEGHDYVDIIFHIQTNDANKVLLTHKFRIVNTPAFNKEGTKNIYVNQSGAYSYVDNEDNLQSYFKTFEDFNTKEIITSDKHGPLTGIRKYRKAIVGEKDFYSLIKAWLGNVNFSTERTNILINIDELFRNPDQFIEKTYRCELKPGAKHATDFAMLLTVNISEKGGETKMYQNIYKEFISLYNYKKFSFAISSDNWERDGMVKKFKEDIEGMHGCKDVYTLTYIQPFNEDAHQQATSEVVKPANTIDWN